MTDGTTDETAGSGAVLPLAEADAPTPDALHRILITFPTDHEINGMRVEIVGVTPEQVAVASYHLTRSANQLSDAITLQAMRERAEIDRVKQELAGGGRGLSIPGRKGRN